MPVARGSRVSARSAFVVGVSGVFVALVLGAVVLFVADRSSNVEVRLGDDQFRDLDAERSARTVERDGPLLFSDVAGGGRDIFVQHLGDDPDTGWLAFDVRPAGESRSCSLQWESADRSFVDNGRCSRELEYPADGAGLTQYPVTVIDGDVVIDLNATGATTSAPDAGAPTSAPAPGAPTTPRGS